MERIRKYELDNGLKTVFYQMKNTYSVALYISVNTGSAFEARSENGITHFLEHIHFRRLNDMSQKDIYCAADRIGGNLNARTYKERLIFSIKVRPRFLRDAVGLFEKILTAGNWTEEDIENEKKVVLNEIGSKEDIFDLEACVDETVFSGSPLAMPTPGTEGTVAAFCLDDILKAKANAFSKGNTAVIAAGNFDDRDIEYINELFGKVKLGDREKTENNFKFKRTERFMECDFEYTNVIASFFVDKSIDARALELLDCITGGGTGSMLQRNVREKGGFSYDIYSYIEEYAPASLINISFSAHSSNVVKAFGEAINTLNSLKSGIGPADYDENIVYYTDNLWYKMESPERIGDDLCWQVFEELKDIEDIIAEYENIKCEDLTRIARHIFTPENCSLLVAGAVSEDLKSEMRKAVESLGETRS